MNTKYIKAVFSVIALLLFCSCEEEFPINSSHFSELNNVDNSLVYEGGKAGDFKAIAKTIDWQNVKKLIIKGHINHNDIYILKKHIKIVEELDFSQADILEGTFPDGIFDENQYLKRFVFPIKMMTTGRGVIYNCSNLEEFILPKEVEILGMQLFSFNRKTTYNEETNETIELSPIPKKLYTIPNMVKVLEEACFKYYPYASLDIPESVEEIKMRCFSTSKLESFTFPPKVTMVADELFYDCERLKTAKLNNKITKIGKEAFFNCKSLQELILPNSVNKVSENFLFGTNLKKLKWSPNITEFPELALAGIKMEELRVPENVTNLGRLCFFESKVKRFYFHKNIKTMGEGLFSYDSEEHSDFITKMEELHVEWQTPPDAGNAFEASINFGMAGAKVYAPYDFSKMKLYVPKGTKELYANAKGWKKFGTIIEE